MTENKVVSLRQPDEIDDPLTEILRSGAKRLIEQAVEAEFAAFLGSHADLKLPDGRQRVVRHGYDPGRSIQTGIGPVEVEKPKARDRGATTAEERIRRSCQNGRGAQKASTSFCLLCICAEFQPGTFRKS